MTSCPCCGSSVDRPVIVSLDTNTVSSSIGSVKLRPKQSTLVHALAKKFPGSVRNEALGVAVWGDDYWNMDTSGLRQAICEVRRDLKPLGIAIRNVYGTGYRLSTSKTEGA